MHWLTLVAIVIGFIAGRELRSPPAECAPVITHQTKFVGVVPAMAPVVEPEVAPVVDEPEEVPVVDESEEMPVDEPGTVDLGSVLTQIAQLEATLANGGALQGRIVDRETREPVVGATIVAWRPGHDGEQVAITDDAGAYTLTGLAAGMYNLRIYAIETVTELTDVAVSSRKVTPLSPELHLYQRHETIDTSYVIHGLDNVE